MTNLTVIFQENTTKYEIQMIRFQKFYSIVNSFENCYLITLPSWLLGLNVKPIGKHVSVENVYKGYIKRYFIVEILK